MANTVRRGRSRVDLLVPALERDEWLAAAAAAGVCLSTWLRRAAEAYVLVQRAERQEAEERRERERWAA